jgi:hypothetical protein
MCVLSQTNWDGCFVLELSNEADVSEERLLITPYLNLATICERYILEADGALTLFRIIDRFIVQGDTPEMPATVIQFTLVVNFRSGNFRGGLDLRLKMIDPNLNTINDAILPQVFEAPEERACQVLGNFRMGIKETGIHWIIVELADQEYTRIPIRILYQKQPTIVSGGG